MPERRGGGRRPGREASWSKASTPSSSSAAAGSSPEWPGARCSLPQAHPLQRPPQAPGSRVLSRVGRGSGCWWVRHGGAPRPPPTRCPVLALAGRRPYPACAVARGTDWTVRRPCSPGCRQCSILWATHPPGARPCAGRGSCPTRCPPGLPLPGWKGTASTLPVLRVMSPVPDPDRPCALGRVTFVPGAWEGLKWCKEPLLHMGAVQRLSAHAGGRLPTHNPQTRPLPAVQLWPGPQPSQRKLLLTLVPSVLVLACSLPLTVGPSPSRPPVRRGEPAPQCDLHMRARPSLSVPSVKCHEVCSMRHKLGNSSQT